MNEFVYLGVEPRFSLAQQGLKILDVGFVESKLDFDYWNIHFIRESLTTKVLKLDLRSFEIQETGDRFSFKICDRCFRYLRTEDSFQNNRLKKNNVITKRPSCKECRVLKDGKKISTADRKIWEKKKPAMYTLFECPICKKTSIHGISKIVLDHNHKTGNVRGYLCESCNTGIGRFDDDVEQVKNAITWLENQT